MKKNMHDLAITLHPQAKNLLFNQFMLFSKIFTNVLGQLETDYLCIALLTNKNELLLFSSSPSSEWNLIEQQLWQSKQRFRYDFFIQEQYQRLDQQEHSTEFGISIAIPSMFEEYRVVYTFASRSRNTGTHKMLLNNIAMLIRMGRFSLKAILEVIPFLERHPEMKHPRPQLKLVVDNQTVSHENTKG